MILTETFWRRGKVSGLGGEHSEDEQHKIKCREMLLICCHSRLKGAAIPTESFETSQNKALEGRALARPKGRWDMMMGDELRSLFSLFHLEVL